MSSSRRCGVSLLPRLRVTGSGVVLRHKGRTDLPPLIAIASFTSDANLWGLVGRPVRLRNVRVEGLEINVPPGGVELDKGRWASGQSPAAAAAAAERRRHLEIAIDR